MQTPVRISAEALREMTVDQFDALQRKCEQYSNIDHVDVLTDFSIGGQEKWMLAIWWFTSGSPLHMGISPKGDTHT
jgi:hypothetical protein